MKKYNFNIDVIIKEEQVEAIDGFLGAWKQDKSLRFDLHKKELGITFILSMLNACIKANEKENS